MSVIVDNMKWIMLVSGLFTCSMLQAFIRPGASLTAMFGESTTETVGLMVVRNWGALIALVGAMLIYGAYHVDMRPIVLIVAGVSKLVFIGLIVSHGGRFLRGQAKMAIVVDSLMIVVFALYLLAAGPVT